MRHSPPSGVVLITPLIWSNFGDLTRPISPKWWFGILTQIQNASASHFSGDPSQHRLVSKTCAALEYIQQHVGLFDARTGRHSYNVNAASAVWQSLCVAGEAHAEADSSQRSTGPSWSSWGNQILTFANSLAVIRKRPLFATTWDPAVIMLIALTNVFTLRHVLGVDTPDEGKQGNQGWWTLIICPDYWPFRSYFTPLRNVSIGWGPRPSCCPNAPWDWNIYLY